MSTIEAILLECIGQGMALSAVDGELHVSCCGGEPDAAVVAQLKTHKQALLRYLQAHQSGSDKRRIASVADEQRSKVLASPAQQRIWFMEQLAPEQALYNMPGAYRLRGALDVPRLQQALDAVLARHESLRTRFIERDGVLLQRVAEPLSVSCPVLDFRLAADQQATLPEVIAQEATRKFDLANDSLLRAVLVLLDGGEALLLITVHHIAADGWSLGILKHEISELYAQAASSLPMPPVTYLDFSEWQRSDLAAGRLTRERDYWCSQLQGAPQLHSLPLDRQRGARQTFQGARFEQLLDAALVARMARFCEAQGVTPFMLMYSLFSLVLGVYSYEPDVVIGTPVAARVHPDVEQTVGMFVNLLALRSRHSDASFREQLQADKQTVLAALAHQSMPLEVLIQSLKVAGSLAHAPLLQILFTWQSQPDAALQLAGLQTVAVLSADQPAKFELELEAAASGSQLQLTWRFDTGIFARESIEHLATALVHALHAALDDPDRSAYSLIGGIEPTLSSDLALSDAEVEELLAQTCHRAGVPKPQSAEARWQISSIGGGPAPIGAMGELQLLIATASSPLGTGRLARLTAARTIEWLGRCDQLIRVNGARVDGAAIERCLQQTAQPRQLSLKVHELADREILLACLALTLESVDAAQLQAACRRALQALMPAHTFDLHCLFVEQIPRTAAGHVDWSALPVPASDAGEPAIAGSDIERQLASIWQGLLGGRCVGMQQNFFTVGGHALAAIRMLNGMYQQFGIDEQQLSLRDVFENPTIAALAQKVVEIRQRHHLEEKVRYLASLDTRLEEGIL